MLDSVVRRFGWVVVAWIGSGVSDLDAAVKEDRRPRLIPIASMSQDVEVLYGKEWREGLKTLDSPDAASVFEFTWQR